MYVNVSVCVPTITAPISLGGSRVRDEGAGSHLDDHECPRAQTPEPGFTLEAVETMGRFEQDMDRL